MENSGYYVYAWHENVTGMVASDVSRATVWNYYGWGGGWGYLSFANLLVITQNSIFEREWKALPQCGKIGLANPIPALLEAEPCQV